MALSGRLALASPLVTTDVIMVSTFPYLAIRYGASDIPATVANGRLAFMGAYPEAEYVDRVMAAAAGPKR